MEIILKGTTMGLTLNHFDVVYGGDVIGLMDIAAGDLARQTIKLGLTKAVNNLTFFSPLNKNSKYEVWAKKTQQGNTSVTIQAEIFQKCHTTEATTKVASGDFVFVKVNEKLQPQKI